MLHLLLEQLLHNACDNITLHPQSHYDETQHTAVPCFGCFFLLVELQGGLLVCHENQCLHIFHLLLLMDDEEIVLEQSTYVAPTLIRFFLGLRGMVYV